MKLVCVYEQAPALYPCERELKGPLCQQQFLVLSIQRPDTMAGRFGPQELHECFLHAL